MTSLRAFPVSTVPAVLALLGIATIAPSAQASGSRLTIIPEDTEPRVAAPTPADIAALRADVKATPEDRNKRVALVRALIRAKDLDGALAEAKAWRAKDAYNLVAVRALGDVYMERGEKDSAERVYSAIVELLPNDPDAQRSLATLLKSRGDLAAAEARLDAAVEARPDDPRLLFELGDVEQRLGKTAAAKTHLEKVIDNQETNEQIRYPAKLRLKQITGGLDNDIHVYLTWDTNRTDVDLWVTTPSKEKVFYAHRSGRDGEALFDDVTTGYGPESFTAEKAVPGEYLVQVNYFSGGAGAFPEARGEVVIVTDEGRPTEKKRVLPYRLFAEKETVTVARVVVGGAK